MAKSEPDGHTLYLTNIGHSISVAYYKKLPYDVENDFAPISILADVPSVLAAPADFSANNVGELIELAKKRPGVASASCFRQNESLGGKYVTRVDAAPDIPAIAESGLPDFNVHTWYGVLAPAGTPKEVIQNLNEEFVAVTNAPKMSERLRAQGAVPVGHSPEKFEAVIKRDIKRWKGVMEASGIEPK